MVEMYVCTRKATTYKCGVELKLYDGLNATGKQ